MMVGLSLEGSLLSGTSRFPRGPSSQEKGVQNPKVHLARGNTSGREKKVTIFSDLEP